MPKTNRIFNIPALSLLIAIFVVSAGCLSDRNMLKETTGTGTSRDALETARVFVKAGDYTKAIRTYDLLLATYTNDTRECAWAEYERAYSYMKMNKKEEAMAGFKALSDKDSTDGPGLMAKKMLEKMEEGR